MLFVVKKFIFYIALKIEIPDDWQNGIRIVISKCEQCIIQYSLL